MKEFTPMELLERLEWRREIRNVMGRISHDYAIKQEAQVYDRYFSRREDVCLGLNNGYYKGAEAVRGYYAALGEEIRLSSALIAKMFPQELEGKTEDELYGVGMISYLPFESQVIEIADDGRTAKGIWNVRGSTSRLTAAGPVANWIFVGHTHRPGIFVIGGSGTPHRLEPADFVLEDGEWKILNLLLLYNVDHQCGVGFTEPEKVFEPVPEFAPMADFHLPEPNVPMTVMETFRPDRPRTRSPRCPEPYATFADTFSYGI